LAEVEVVLIIQDQSQKLTERDYKEEYEDSYPASLGRTGLAQHVHTLPSRDAEAGFLGYLRVIIKNGSSLTDRYQSCLSRLADPTHDSHDILDIQRKNWSQTT